MVRAYVLIKVEAGKNKAILDLLRNTPNVDNVESVTGPTDLIAQVSAESARALADLIFTSIQTIAGVKETDTRIIISG
jgi:DNA-binding Lrp family transcriptional regulator